MKKSEMSKTDATSVLQGPYLPLEVIYRTTQGAQSASGGIRRAIFYFRAITVVLTLAKNMVPWYVK